MFHVEQLVGAGLWRCVGTSYEVNDYLEFNPSKEKVEREREQARERKRKSRRGDDGRYMSRRDSHRDSHRDYQRDSRRDSARSHTDPSRPVPPSTRERDGGSSSASSTDLSSCECGGDKHQPDHPLRHAEWLAGEGPRVDLVVIDGGANAKAARAAARRQTGEAREGGS